jgi:hypothetical protein
MGDAVKGEASRHGGSACQARVTIICGVLSVPGNGAVINVWGYDRSGLPTPPELIY